MSRQLPLYLNDANCVQLVQSVRPVRQSELYSNDNGDDNNDDGEDHSLPTYLPPLRKDYESHCIAIMNAWAYSRIDTTSSTTCLLQRDMSSQRLLASYMSKEWATLLDRWVLRPPTSDMLRKEWPFMLNLYSETATIVGLCYDCRVILVSKRRYRDSDAHLIGNTRP